ncbi:MAG TPA: hypothetical protein VLG16_01455 [Candidatus Saccharimonadales bacterium]|nr:hypothetical protein [Candidatus Saccharimonadales bacterium]
MINRMLGILLVIIFVIIISVYFKLGEDKLRQYRDVLSLEKANLAYSNDYQKVRDLILPTRQTAFDKSEPVIWLYRRGTTELFLGANWRGDIRIWLEPKTVLKGVHIVLDGTLNNSMRSNLKKDKLPQRQVELEGNFSKHFKLYCNEGQQVVALQVIAPDIMAYLLDNLLNADIEVIDSQVAIIIRNGAKTLDRLKASIELADRIERLARAATKVARL